ncbi:MAG: 5-oxoprolinase subunit PxpB [Pseudomarimonas sp.]
MSRADPVVSRLGDSALLLRWSSGNIGARNEHVHRVASALAQVRPSWLLDLVPAFSSLALIIDPATDTGAMDMAERWLHRQLTGALAAEAKRVQTRCIEIPVCYAPTLGPDLADLADAHGITVAEVIARHCAPTYRVAMLGFAPGFPYLLGLDPTLAMARLATPRIRVEAGSVGIGGDQTGIYPRSSAGGWRLLGRTPLNLFDPQRDPPSLLQAGDEMRFVPIDRDAFDAWST